MCGWMDGLIDDLPMVYGWSMDGHIYDGGWSMDGAWMMISSRGRTHRPLSPPEQCWRMDGWVHMDASIVSEEVPLVVVVDLAHGLVG